MTAIQKNNVQVFGEGGKAPEVVGHYLHQHLAHSEPRVMKATGHGPHLSAPEEALAAPRTFQ
jgi:sigma-B regulation protein RsbQ